LRDVRDVAATSLATEIGHKIAALKAMLTRIQTIQEYIEKVLAGGKANHEIFFRLQEAFNHLPDTNSLAQSFAVNQNNTYLALYLASITRGVVSLHSLINNKVKA
jgi:26S proteasome regulatory subunit N8